MNGDEAQVFSCGLKIVTPGPLSLIQTRGRQHVQGLGLSEGGACDTHAYSWANYLLSNPQDAATLEITLGPFEAEFCGDTLIAVCGSEINCSINNRRVSNWSTHKVTSGDRIKMTPTNNGLRSYLAVKNGFRTLKQFGSYCELPKETFAARIVIRNALLPYAAYTDVDWIEKTVPSRFIPNYHETLILKVQPCYQFSEFSNVAKNTFTEHDFTVTANCDRMGYRLSGRPIRWDAGDIVSEGIAFGSVQIPPDGQPIILLNDRQTIGGYPKIGCVHRQGCDQLAQRQTGQKVKFVFETIEQ